MLTMLEASEVIRLGGLPYIFPLHIRFFYENSKLLKEYPFQQVTIKRCLNIDYYVNCNYFWLIIWLICRFIWLMCPWNSESKPRRLYFSKALFEGLTLEGLKYGGKFALQNQLGLYLGGNLHLKIDWVSLYYVSNLREVFTETRCEDADVSRIRPSKLKIANYFIENAILSAKVR